MSSTKEKKGDGLRKGRLGVAAIVFFVVAASAPMAGMTGVVPVAAVLGTGAAVPGAYVLVGAILLLFSVGFTAMSNKVTNAGAFFAYVGKGLGVNMGVGSAFASILAYLTVQLAIFGFFGAIANAFFTPIIGFDLGWLGCPAKALVTSLLHHPSLAWATLGSLTSSTTSSTSRQKA
jgi:amino acid transporter